MGDRVNARCGAGDFIVLAGEASAAGRDRQSAHHHRPGESPWYFVGLQELLEHMHPTLAGVIVPTILVLFLVALPYIDHSRVNVGVWFSSARGKRIVGWTTLYTLLVMPAYILLDSRFSLRELLRDAVPQWVAQGLLPAVIIAVLVALPALVVRRLKGDVREMMLVLFTVMFVSAVVFTVSGFLFRGPGFKLYLPWQMPPDTTRGMDCNF